LKKTNPSSSSKDSDFGREQYLYLTTRGRKSSLPREIEIWFTGRDGRFFLIAEYPTSQWVQNLRAHPEAQVRVAGGSFTVRARFVSPETEPELHATVAGLSREKYGWGEGLIVELVPKFNGT
jgi:deazaflavin-dependent oxidoreductase (nitroreductase family)